MIVAKLLILLGLTFNVTGGSPLGRVLLGTAEPSEDEFAPFEFGLGVAAAPAPYRLHGPGLALAFLPQACAARGRSRGPL